MADGSIIIDTKIDDNGMAKGFQRIKNEMGGVAQQAQKMGNDINTAFSGTDFSKPVARAQAQVNSLERQLAALSSQFKIAIDNDDDISAERLDLKRMAVYERLETAREKLAIEIEAAARRQAEAEEAAAARETAAAEKKAAAQQKAAKKELTAINKSGKATSFHLGNINKGFGRLASRIGSLISGAFVFNIISRGLSQVSKYFGTALKSNDAFSKSFARLKGALLTAFQPIYEYVVPALTTMMNVLARAAQVVGQFFAALTGKSYSQMAKNAEGLYNTASGIEAVGGAAKETKKILSGLDEINTLTPDSGGGGGGGSAVEIPDFSVEEVGNFSSKVLELINGGDWRAVGEALAQKINNAIKTVDTEEVGKNFSAIFAGAFNAGAGFFDGLDGKEIGKKIYKFFKGINWGDIIRSIIEFAGSAVDLAEEIIIGIFEPMIDDVKEWFVDTFTEEGELTGESFLNGLGSMFKNIGGWFYRNIIEPIERNFGDVIAIGPRIGDGTGKGFLNALSNLPGKAGSIFSELKERLTNDAGEIEFSLSDVWENIKEGALAAFSAIPEGVASAFSTLESKIKYAINNHILLPMNMFIKKVIDGANSMFDSIRNIGSALGLGSFTNIGRVRMVSIPYLAQGAVIPANAPFMAVLGDQKHGKNLEAPEGLIRQIIREEMGGGKGGGDLRIVAQINRRTLFDETIAEAKLRQASTGKNPFNLT